ncbi:MAG: hypothetical protein PHF97_01750 [Bacteroidales bacterium]|nr:hypothetical protein [Bacteroidales bacterium]
MRTLVCASHFTRRWQSGVQKKTKALYDSLRFEPGAKKMILIVINKLECDFPDRS